MNDALASFIIFGKTIAILLVVLVIGAIYLTAVIKKGAKNDTE